MANPWAAAEGVPESVEPCSRRLALGWAKSSRRSRGREPAIELADRTGHRWYEAEAHRVLGDVLLALSDLGAAEIAMNFPGPALVNVLISLGSARKPQQFRWDS
jgi:hypothetical protein